MFQLEVNGKDVRGWHWIWGAPVLALLLFVSFGFWLWGLVAFVQWIAG
ncbi:membrane protein [Roseibium sp. TrichSKD4]|nr:membrane protein [Roseibium sp. TrichSKD4]